MYKFRKSVCSVMLICVVIMLFVQSTLATSKSINELQNERDALKKTEQATNEKLNETREDKAEVVTDLQKIDAQIIELEDALLLTSERLDNTEIQLKQTESDLEAAIQKREDQYETLRKRIKFMYENGEEGYLEAILSSNSFTDLLNRTEYIQDIVEYDQNLLQSLKATENLIQEKKDEIILQKTELELLKDEQLKQQEGLEAARETKQQLLNTIEDKEKQYEAQIAQLEGDADAITTLILKKQEEARKEAQRKAAEAQANSNNNANKNNTTSSNSNSSTPNKNSNSSATNTQPSYSGNGQFAWPAPSYVYISSGYVNRTNPVTGSKEFHSGVDLASAYGTDIVAAESGTVTMSQTYGGYGECIMIDHGNGYSTLYGHCSKRLVSVGESVSRGQVIGKVGSTGQSTGNHLHFEVRVNGSHTNPLPFIQ